MDHRARFNRLADGRVRWLVGGVPFRGFGGELHNSSGSSRASIAAGLDAVRALGGDTALVPISWELIEPEEGRFDLSLVECLIGQAADRSMRVIPLWFGTYKNAGSGYVPVWVKRDLRRFPRARLDDGSSTGAISVLCEEAAACDARAWATVCEAIARLDPAGVVVPAVQIENEVGLLGAMRDRCALADAAFAGSVPSELLEGLARAPALRNEVARPWLAAGGLHAGAWNDVFGAAAEEVFMAWHFARFVDRVAAAGKRSLPVPAFVNAWLVQFPGERPGCYPSGGPVAGMREVWRLGAPSIDAQAVDVYLDDFAAVAADYHQDGNPLLAPEMRRDEAAAAKAWYALGQHDCLLFCPFGIESYGRGSSPPIDGVVALGSAAHESGPAAAERLRRTFELMRLVAARCDHLLGTPAAVGILQRSDEPQTVLLGGYRLTARWSQAFAPGGAVGGGLIVLEGEGEFFAAGQGFHLQIQPDGPGRAEPLSIDELLPDEHLRPGRRLNGDESGIRFGSEPGARRCAWHTIP